MANFLPFLREVFPDRTDDHLSGIINLIREECPNDSYEQQIENMVLLLSGGDGPLLQNLQEQIDVEGAVGYDSSVFQPSKSTWQSLWERFQEALPDASPAYLKEQAMNLVEKDDANIENFLIEAIENKDYPTMEEYRNKHKEDEGLNFYKTNIFNIEEFLKKFPDPEGVFADPCHPNPLEAEDATEDDTLYAVTFLYNQYPYIRKKDIDLVFSMKKNNLIQSCIMLDSIDRGLKRPRAPVELPDIRNLLLLQEVAFLKHRKIINYHMNYKDDTYRVFKEEARLLQLLKNCIICDEELIPDECFTCQNGCVFCKNCLDKYIQVKMGDAQVKFPCANCDSSYSLQTLQLVIGPHRFNTLLLKIQSEEIRQANVEGTETCPFCDYTGIPPEGSIIFSCQNPDCMKESCRKCRHESHIPKRCNEIEYDEDVQRRTFIENMMTEALARTCYSCKKKFVKTTGCNKMVCSCGAMMCYLCSQPVQNYDHFRTNKCQLFTNDKEIDLNRVREWAEKAKKELGNVEIKFDPAIGIEQFFT